MSEADIEKSEMSSDISDESDYLALSTNIGAGHNNGDEDLPGDDNQDAIEDSGGDYEKSSTLEVKEAVKLNLSGVFFVFYFDKYNNSIILIGARDIKDDLKAEDIGKSYPSKKDHRSTRKSSTLFYWCLAISFVLGATVIAILIGSNILFVLQM